VKQIQISWCNYYAVRMSTFIHIATSTLFGSHRLQAVGRCDLFVSLVMVDRTSIFAIIEIYFTSLEANALTYHSDDCVGITHVLAKLISAG